ncbi:hypothetical protein BpHYR1_049525 [Brachionus plicatilis]|uniref:Uncharacterized protein n=1 Tax=Brachionus plicatilis TaxID=10195 RepID=A0A3M7REA8_BRAPC|nr:hypothetical protein BpHYR1_049525 [Brachionus plicatilis]
MIYSFIDSDLLKFKISKFQNYPEVFILSSNFLSTCAFFLFFHIFFKNFTITSNFSLRDLRNKPLLIIHLFALFTWSCHFQSCKDCSIITISLD